MHESLLPTLLRSLSIAGLLAFAQLALADDSVAPPCYGPENYATQSALVDLVNSGRVADAASIYRDDKTPYGLTTALLDAEPVGRFSGPGLPESTVVRQIQKIEVKTRGGDAFVLLTISEVSAAECALSAPTVLLMQPEYVVLRVGESVLKPLP